jgi:hypothetical protein
MCGCGCELGLVMAACRAAEVQSTSVQAAPAMVSARLTLFERWKATWFASLIGETLMQRSPLENLSRGSGR